jgi:hypothetical protein
MMKNIKSLVVMLTLCGLSLFSACKKDGDNTSSPRPASQISFKANDTLKTIASPDSITAAIALTSVASGYSYTGTTLAVSCRVPNGKDTNIFLMTVTNVPATMIGSYPINWSAAQIITAVQGGGTFDLNSLPCIYASPSTLAGAQNIDITNPLVAFQFAAAGGTGSVNITGFDAIRKQITGTFNFSLNLGPLGRANITEGVMTNLNSFK